PLELLRKDSVAGADQRIGEFFQPELGFLHRFLAVGDAFDQRNLAGRFGGEEGRLIRIDVNCVFHDRSPYLTVTPRAAANSTASAFEAKVGNFQTTISPAALRWVRQPMTSSLVA